MKVLIIGQGGREHAIAWKIAQSEQVSQVFVAPGNGGTALEAKVQNLPIPSTDLKNLLRFAKAQAIDLTIVGPEGPLLMGLADLFQSQSLKCLGPGQKAAQLEGSKIFCKELLLKANIPTAAFRSFNESEFESAADYLHTKKPPYVIKADGLAAGKGVSIIQTVEEGLTVARQMLCEGAFEGAGKRIVVEDFLTGEELSFIVLVDGKTIVPLASSQDHKRRDNHDQGPNTGGMGAYSPAPMMTPELSDHIIERIIQPTLAALFQQGISYQGFLYAGLMINANQQPWVLEFNVRLGDPETQVLLPRLTSDFFTLCYQAASGDLSSHPALTWDPKPCLGIVMASRDYPHTAVINEQITGFLHTQDPDQKVFHAATYVNEKRELYTHGGRVLCVTQKAPMLRDAQQKAYRCAETIHWEHLFYRTDIGMRAMGRV
jgi:phosphoribosylamine--glycine ligase